MKLLRRTTLGGLLAAFVYFASACAQGNEEPSVEPEGDAGGATDAGKDGRVTQVQDSGGSDAPRDTGGGPTCTGKVVINELMTAGASAADEFVEIFNTASCAISLAGW